jgi:WD40 repeat protein
MSNVMCLEMDPKGKYFATGSADALVGLWDADEMVCLRVSVETGPHHPPPKATENARSVRETPCEAV